MTFARVRLTLTSCQAYPYGMAKRRARRTAVPVSGSRCSFCGKPDETVRRLIAGPGVLICDECVGLCNQILAKESTGFGSLEHRSDEALLEGMARLDASRSQVEHAVDEYARELRDRGVSWTAIGRALGVSRQSAWERFGPEV